MQPVGRLQCHLLDICRVVVKKEVSMPARMTHQCLGMPSPYNCQSYSKSTGGCVQFSLQLVDCWQKFCALVRLQQCFHPASIQLHLLFDFELNRLLSMAVQRAQ